MKFTPCPSFIFQNKNQIFLDAKVEYNDINNEIKNLHR